MAHNTMSSDKPKGWFSRRHATDEAHRAAVARYKLAHEKKGESPKREAGEQWRRLDERLGKGIGAFNERNRLQQAVIKEYNSRSTTEIGDGFLTY